MDGTTLLREVSEAYRQLRTLQVEAALIAESGDENASQRLERRVRFFYAAPGRFRFEPCSQRGLVQVCNDRQLHTLLSGGPPGAPPGYYGVPSGGIHPPPHLFRPDSPFAEGDEPFLYQGIDNRVTTAEVERTEADCYVVAVGYEPSRHIIVSGPVVRFWIHRDTRMVMRQEGEMGFRQPAEEEVSWTRHTYMVRQMSVNEPLPEGVFDFTPPPGVQKQEAAGGGECAFSVGGGGSFTHEGTSERDQLEHSSWHNWDGTTLAEHSKWKIRGKTLKFERRLTFSDDDSQLQVDEKADGPVGHAESSYSLRVG